jgi:hypothetical protein
MRRCYGCDYAEARYEARLDWDATPVVLLCDACAVWERTAGSVIWIRTLDTASAEAVDGPRGC